MHKLIVLYKGPPDPEEFREHYENVHVPLLRKMPGIVHMNYSFDIKDAEGHRPYFCIFEAYFENAEDMVNGLNTPEGAAVIEDLQNYDPGPHEIINFPVMDDR